VGIEGEGSVKWLGNEADRSLPLVLLSRTNGTIHGLPRMHRDFIVSYHFEELSIDGMIILTFTIESDHKMVFKL
jgi:hypothetical protein